MNVLTPVPAAAHHSSQPHVPASRQALALREALEDAGALPPGYVAQWEETFEHWVPENGAKVVAKAWIDDDFRARLLVDGAAACRELGFGGAEGGHIVVVQNKPDVHNVIVCTLCSCTAWPVLGLPPDWYKSFEYRSRVVREARQVLREMGLDLPPNKQILVWDTTAETRYMVLPERPPETVGWTSAQLAAIVTKDCLIGVAVPQTSFAER
jgi:nitrile hydratase subunit alpha